MGKPQSKVVSHNGDPQVRIINMQEMHTEQHELKLYLILGIVIIQLGITIYRLRKKNMRKQAIKTAKSIINLTELEKLDKV